MRALLVTYHVIGAKRTAFFTRLCYWLLEMGFSVDVFTYPYYSLDILLRHSERNNCSTLVRLKKGFREQMGVVRNFTVPRLLYFRIVRHFPKPIKQAYLTPRTLESMLQGPYDLAIFESTIGICFFDLFRKLNPKAKVIYRPSDPLCFVPPYNLDWYILGCEKAVIETADMVLFVSDETKQKVLEYYCLKDDPDRFTVLRNPVEDVVFQDFDTKPLPLRKKRAIYAGFFPVEWSLVASLANVYRNYEFFIIGPRRKIREKNVVVPGELPFEEVVNCIHEARVGIIPYRYIGKINEHLLLTKKVILMMKARMPILAMNTSPEVTKYGLTLATSPDDFVQKFAELISYTEVNEYFYYNEKVLDDFREKVVYSNFKAVIQKLLQR